MQDDGITTMKQNAGGPTKQYVDDTESGTAARAPQTKVVAEGQKQFSLEANQSVTFRWTPITPKPKEPVTYRIRVWQMMQGQTGNTAMAKNEPVVTREVTGSSEVTVSGILTGPCRPPYLCDFVWSVESVSKSDAASGSGGSAPSAVQSSPADVPKPTEVAPESASGGVAR